jgi:hypothetical protein
MGGSSAFTSLTSTLKDISAALSRSSTALVVMLPESGSMTTALYNTTGWTNHNTANINMYSIMLELIKLMMLEVPDSYVMYKPWIIYYCLNEVPKLIVCVCLNYILATKLGSQMTHKHGRQGRYFIYNIFAKSVQFCPDYRGHKSDTGIKTPKWLRSQLTINSLIM